MNEPGSDTRPQKRLLRLPAYPSPAMTWSGTPWWARVRALIGIPAILVFFGVVLAGVIVAAVFGLFVIAQQVFLT